MRHFPCLFIHAPETKPPRYQMYIRCFFPENFLCPRLYAHNYHNQLRIFLVIITQYSHTLSIMTLMVLLQLIKVECNKIFFQCKFTSKSMSCWSIIVLTLNAKLTVMPMKEGQMFDHSLGRNLSKSCTTVTTIELRKSKLYNKRIKKVSMHIQQITVIRS